MTTDTEALRGTVALVTEDVRDARERSYEVAPWRLPGRMTLGHIETLCAAALRVAEAEKERDAARAELAAARERYDRLAEVRSQERETRQPAPPLILHVDAAKAHRLRSRLIAVEAALREIRDGECNDRVYEIARAALEGGGE